MMILAFGLSLQVAALHQGTIEQRPNETISDWWQEWVRQSDQKLFCSKDIPLPYQPVRACEMEGVKVSAYEKGRGELL